MCRCEGHDLKQSPIKRAQLVEKNHPFKRRLLRSDRFADRPRNDMGFEVSHSGIDNQ